MNILIPQLVRVKLSGYSPIFTETVEFSIDNKLFIILGGNGLGKTTILQSVIFGIAGPSDENIEPLFKERRWNRQYFKDRLDNPNGASIDITFLLGNNQITLKRSISSDKISEFILNGELLTDDRQLADEYFETFLQNDCGYNALSDFNFIIHQLCYLSEKRENLAWELESQTRILMQILSDRNTEKEFRGKRAIVKEMDSAIRHKTVEINALDKRIQQKPDIQQTSQKTTTTKEAIEINPEKEQDLDKLRLDLLQKNVIEVSNLTISKQKEFNDLRYRHSIAVIEIENLRDQLSKFEHAFFFEQLNKFESEEAKLAIYKLIHYHLCPACGTKSDSLYEQANKFIKDSCCPICGTSQVIETDTINPGTEAELSEKIKLKMIGRAHV